jgi:CrcB protein
VPPGGADRWATLGLLAAGGAAGAVARHLLSGWLARPGREWIPWGTLAVNLSGCLLLGVVLATLDRRLPDDRAWRLLLAVGFLGAFTTFSTFAWELHGMLGEGAAGRALAYAGGSLLLGLAAVAAGLAIARGA